MRRRAGEPLSRMTSPLFRFLRRNVSVITFLVVSIVGMLAVYQFFNSRGPDPPPEIQSDFLQSPVVMEEPVATSSTMTSIEETPVIDDSTEDSPSNLIGIIAGHRGYDSGTVCEDGLTEVQITTEIAEKVAALLRESELKAETLNEFDPRIDEYQAAALVSIHIDSCDYINDLATGFKISGSSYTDSSELSTCVQEAYGNTTQLKYHPNSITPEMAGYHAFRKVDDGTPAIIIEVGFLNLDREILTDDIDEVAEGLFDGIKCYMDLQ
jgi:N-acetylmuramoyl-L-alanine amidase